MNQLLEQPVTQTPIEIALQVDGEGRTTARKLYAFLELASGQFSRWAKTNILENDFAEENTDFEGFDIYVEGNKTKDYKLTASFAKKLAMGCQNEKGEQAKQYFIEVEDKLKNVVKAGVDVSQLSPELQMFKQIFDSVAKTQIAQKEQEKAIEDTNKRIDSIKEVVALNPNDWRKDTSRLINRIALKAGGYGHLNVIREESYKLLDERFGVALSIRLTNMKKTMSLNGVCKSKIDKLNKLDVIANDKKLIEGYVAIIKDMCIRYGVDQAS